MQQWLRERIWILCNAHIFCLVECETCWCIKQHPIGFIRG